MIYFDYSATTPVNKQVLQYFCYCNNKYIGNANSTHKLGTNSKKAILLCSKKIKKLLSLFDEEIIYTSGSTESNNLAILGVAEKYYHQKKNIVTTYFEHPSVIATLGYLQNHGFEIRMVDNNVDGKIDLNHLDKIIDNNTILVSIGSVNSEIGIRQPIEKIKEITKNKHCLFHCDMTQSIGKEKVEISGIDLVSFSAHKFYGLKGIGVLVVAKNVEISPQVHGGRSISNLRSGTPALPLILSLGYALKLAYQNWKQKDQHVRLINSYLSHRLQSIPNVVLNSNADCIPHIMNISILGIKGKKIVDFLSKENIYVSHSTACSLDNSKSLAIMAIFNDEKRAISSIRISLSARTTKKEINILVATIEKMVKCL